MRELKGSGWGITVDKSNATTSFPVRGTSYPKGSGLNHPKTTKGHNSKGSSSK